MRLKGLQAQNLEGVVYLLGVNPKQAKTVRLSLEMAIYLWIMYEVSLSNSPVQSQAAQAAQALMNHSRTQYDVKL